MDKIGRPRSLISYDTVRHLESAGHDLTPVNTLRPRVVLYATAMTIVGVIMLTALLLRPDLGLNVLHDRNPIYVKLSDGGLRNGYTIKILNKAYAPRDFTVSTQGLTGATLSVVGHEKLAQPLISVPADGLEAVRVYVALDKAATTGLDGAATEFHFVVKERGWRTEVGYDGKTRRLTLSFLDKAMAPIAGLHVAASLGRPATDQEDRRVVFTETSHGVYDATVDVPPGFWVISIDSRRKGDGLADAYRLKRRLFVAETP
jgi:hypothetical protein